MLSPWIHTTEKCQLKCPYCYVRGDGIMQQEVYNALGKMLPPDSHLRIAGGEPLLVYGNWKEWATQWKSVEVLTNLRYVPDGYYDMGFHTSVSVDGCGEKPLDKEIIKNISRLKTPWLMTTIIDLDALPILAEYVSKTNCGWAVSTDYWWQGTPAIDDLIVMMVEVVRILKRNNYNFQEFIFNNVDFSGRGGCDAGGDMFAVNCNGDIYSCQTQFNQATPIGDVFNGYVKKSCKKNHAECQDCCIKGVCTGWCPLYFKPGDLCDVYKFIVWEVLYA